MLVGKDCHHYRGDAEVQGKQPSKRRHEVPEAA